MRYIYTVVALLLALTAQAQTDSVRTEYKTEDETISKSEIKRFIRYITRANVEEKTLVKIGGWPISDQNLTFPNHKFKIGFAVEINVEQKISPSISVFAGVNGFSRFITYDFLQTPSVDPLTRYSTIKANNFQVDWKLGTRYYHSMANRIRKGKSANNFSGNYITAQAAVPAEGYSDVRFFDRGEQRAIRVHRVGNVFDVEIETPRVLVAYGIQRRLGRLGYFDVNAGPELRYARPIQRPKHSVTFQLNAIVGVGW